MSAPQKPTGGLLSSWGQVTTAPCWPVVPLALYTVWGATAQPGREAHEGAGGSASAQCLPWGGGRR